MTFLHTGEFVFHLIHGCNNLIECFLGVSCGGQSCKPLIEIRSRSRKGSGPRFGFAGVATILFLQQLRKRLDCGLRDFLILVDRVTADANGTHAVALVVEQRQAARE